MRPETSPEHSVVVQYSSCLPPWAPKMSMWNIKHLAGETLHPVRPGTLCGLTVLLHAFSTNFKHSLTSVPVGTHPHTGHLWPGVRTCWPTVLCGLHQVTWHQAVLQLSPEVHHSLAYTRHQLSDLPNKPGRLWGLVPGTSPLIILKLLFLSLYSQAESSIPDSVGVASCTGLSLGSVSHLYY